MSDLETAIRSLIKEETTAINESILDNLGELRTDLSALNNRLDALAETDPPVPEPTPEPEPPTDGEPGSNKFTIQILDKGYQHVTLKWNRSGAPDRALWVIQRSTVNQWNTPTNLRLKDLRNREDNTGKATCRSLGLNVDQYTDIDSLEDNKVYYWRVAAVLNMAEHLKQNEPLRLTPWQYGKTRLDAKPTLPLLNVTSGPFNAPVNTSKNCYPAIRRAWNEAHSKGGGKIYLPKGKYTIWPTSKDQWELFKLDGNNIEFIGDGPGKTVIDLRSWDNKPATEWIEYEGRGRREARRYAMFKVTTNAGPTGKGVENFTLDNMTINGNATPVTIGSAPGLWSIDNQRYEWDERHKLIEAHGPNNMKLKNFICQNIETSGWRGEVIYVGGASENWLVKDCVIKKTNSSAISCSANLEIVNTLVEEAANAGVESFLFANKKSQFGDYRYNQYHIMRNSTFRQYPKGGLFRSLDGKTTLSGWHAMGARGAYVLVDGSLFADPGQTIFGPWFESHDTLYLDNKVTGYPAYLGPNDSSHVIFFRNGGRVAQKDKYSLTSGISNAWVLGLDVHLSDEARATLKDSQNLFLKRHGATAGEEEGRIRLEHIRVINDTNKKISWPSAIKNEAGASPLIVDLKTEGAVTVGK